MSTSTRSVDVAPARRLGAAHLALLLAIVSLPGSMLPWDWFAWGGVVIGVPIAVAAIVVGVRARRTVPADSSPARIALAAIVLAAAVLLIPVVWIIATAVS